jgi:alpha-glucosidase
MYPPGNAELPASYYGKENPELHMAFNFSFLYCKWTANSFQKVILEWEKTLGYKNWPNYTLSNHDQVRHITKYSKANHTFPRAKIAAVMLLTLRGTPFLYYGEEIGMESDKIPKNKLCDPLGKRYWPLYSGRDNCRQPMCWNSTEQNFGFSKAEPWLPISKNGSFTNVDEELKNKTSLLTIYKKLIQVRKKEIVLRRGSLRVLFLNNDKILSYVRMYEKERILILLNFTPEETRFFSGDENLEVERGKVLFSTHRKEESYFDLNIIALLPYEASIIKLET